ncbi:MAG TPA: glutamine amidotransferase family protein [Xanthobacteraceae bacterium]|nr:glutamine amidotransferase family protein [Xanthobacteraceae bacterium]
MCGIVGLFLKDDKLSGELGALLAGMLGTLCDRGPDSAGFAVYRDGRPGELKLTLRCTSGADLDSLIREVAAAAGVPVKPTVYDTHVVVSIPGERETAVRAALARVHGVSIVGGGRRMEIFKEVGRPDRVAGRFGLQTMTGTHGIGHTRMATESAVTTDGAHPFTTGPDQCLVHNGSLSNHNAVRRELVREGLTFETENDSEVAAGYLTYRLRHGASLEQAMEGALTALDGFYTFVIGTEAGFGVLRDPIACKPAVMAETSRWVAFGTEYRALVDLPGIEGAKVWEPEPARVYRWERH